MGPGLGNQYQRPGFDSPAPTTRLPVPMQEGIPRPMDYDELVRLRQRHPAWRLLAPTHAPFIIGFLHSELHRTQRAHRGRAGTRRPVWRTTSFHLRETPGRNRSPRTALDYLNEWAGDARMACAATIRPTRTSPTTT